jgi:hypothetical protein
LRIFELSCKITHFLIKGMYVVAVGVWNIRQPNSIGKLMLISKCPVSMSVYGSTATWQKQRYSLGFT